MFHFYPHFYPHSSGRLGQSFSCLLRGLAATKSGRRTGSRTSLHGPKQRGYPRHHVHANHAARAHIDTRTTAPTLLTGLPAPDAMDASPMGLAGALADAAIKAAPSSQCRTARLGRRCRRSHDSGSFSCPGIAGLASFTCTRTRPVAELTGIPFLPLRFVRCTRARSPPQSPAMPDAGPLSTSKAVKPSGPAQSPRQPRAWCQVRRNGAGPDVLRGRLRCNRRVKRHLYIRPLVRGLHRLGTAAVSKPRVMVRRQSLRFDEHLPVALCSAWLAFQC